MRKQNRKHCQAEPSKEWGENQLGDREAREIERLFIPVPFLTVESKRKLDHTETDDEEHESMTVRMI